MRKSELTRALQSESARTEQSQQVLQHLVKQNETLVLENNELKSQVKLYEWAFSIATGRLYAHSGDGLDLAVFTSNLLAEAISEIGDPK
jgi:hypothetical protein